MKSKVSRHEILARNGADWRNWLLEYHEKSNGVWLIFYYKSSSKESIYYDEAVDHALCFGWIDSKPNKRDHESSYRYFSPRSPRSNWSRVNKAKIERLTKLGLMHASGLNVVATAKANGTWNALDDVENLILPPDLKAEFEKHTHALNHWNSFPRSAKRGILEWILNAKKPETRAKRIEETARLAQQNIRANQYQR